MSELKLIEVSQIDDHPRNPRVSLRQDVIDGIAANLNGEYPKQHALRVRPVGDRFETISGHHRKQGAIKAGIFWVWCWVEEMDDETAFMELVTSNNQGELDPLEIGIHCFQAVPNNRGKKGGGIQEYAAKVGRAKSTMTELRNAGEVIEMSSVNRTHFIGRSQHLAAIHKLNRECWLEACEWLAKSTESVKDIQARVELAKEENIPYRQVALFLKKTTARELERIDEIFAKLLAELEAEPLAEQLATEWREWFVETKPIDVKVIQSKRIEFEDRLAELLEEPPPELPNLVLADPPWKYDFAETDNRQIENQYPTATVQEIIEMEPDTEGDCVLFLWATVAKLKEALEVMEGWGFQYKTHAVWDKGKIGMGYWFRGQHELLLVGTKGQFSPPETDNRVSSVFQETRSAKHSKKPSAVYQWIESAFPQTKKMEMFCREPRKGWMAWGNESGS